MKTFDLFTLDDVDKMEIYRFLPNYIRDTGTLAEDIADAIMEAAKDDEFRKPIQMWLNQASDLSSCELEVNGIFLRDMIEKYTKAYPNEGRLGALISIYLLWLEKTVPEMRGICFFLTDLCHAEPCVAKGSTVCYEAELFDDGWWFISRELSTRDASGEEIEIAVREYDLWIILLHNPMLFTALAVDFKTRIRLILDETGKAYDIYSITEGE